MRIERHNDTVSFDGGTMSTKDALKFALELANTAWRYSGDAAHLREGKNGLTFCTVEMAVAMKDIYDSIYVHGDAPVMACSLVGEIRRDRMLSESAQVEQVV